MAVESNFVILHKNKIKKKTSAHCSQVDKICKGNKSIHIILHFLVLIFQWARIIKVITVAHRNSSKNEQMKQFMNGASSNICNKYLSE